MTEAEALLKVASAIHSLSQSVSFIGFVLFWMLLFKNMGGKATDLSQIEDALRKIVDALRK